MPSEVPTSKKVEVRDIAIAEMVSLISNESLVHGKVLSGSPYLDQLP